MVMCSRDKRCSGGHDIDNEDTQRDGQEGALRVVCGSGGALHYEAERSLPLPKFSHFETIFDREIIDTMTD